MVELIVGKKGKGKTKVLLDRVNGAVKEANGSIVYLDKSTKHMYELNNKVRLIDVSSYPLKNADEFVGFICGIISQDHDLEQIYLDSFLKVSKLEDADVTDTLDQLRTKAHQLIHTLSHLLSSLIGKSNSQNIPRIYSLFIHQIGNPVCQHSCLAGTSSRQDQDWSLCLCYRLALRGI